MSDHDIDLERAARTLLVEGHRLFQDSPDALADFLARRGVTVSVHFNKAIRKWTVNLIRGEQVLRMHDGEKLSETLYSAARAFFGVPRKKVALPYEEKRITRPLSADESDWPSVESVQASLALKKIEDCDDPPPVAPRGEGGGGGTEREEDR